VLGSYGLVDLSARVRVTHWVSLKGSVKNIFDEEYEELLGFGTPPRSYFAEAEVRFGPDMR
jgi:vitamin B12 transporter